MQFYENYANQKNLWCLTPRNQELSGWWYKTSAQWFLLREKYEKLAARRFITKSQKITHNSCIAWRTFNAARRFLENSKNMKTTKVLIIPRDHMHVSCYTNIIKQLYTWKSSLKFEISLQSILRIPSCTKHCSNFKTLPNLCTISFDQMFMLWKTSLVIPT